MPAKVAIFVPTLEGGGAEASMIRLANGLAGRGFKVDLVLKKNVGEHSQLVSENIRIIDFQAPSMRHTLGKLISYLRKEQPSVLISALELPNLVSIFARMAVRKKPRVIISIRGVFSQQKAIFNKRIDRLLFRLIYPLADWIVCVSNSNAEDAIRYLHLPRRKVKTIYNPVIDEELYRKSNEPVTFDWFDKPGKKTILTIGRLEEVKDQKTLIHAFRMVKETCDTRLIILGEGSLRTELMKLIADNGLEEDVIMPGFISKPHNILIHSDVFVMSSLHESLSEVTIQSLACQCPVVSTACGGPEEILDNGRYGHLVSIGDAQEMAKAILLVFEGDKRLAPKDWLVQFQCDRNIEQYIKLM